MNFTSILVERFLTANYDWWQSHCQLESKAWPYLFVHKSRRDPWSRPEYKGKTTRWLFWGSEQLLILTCSNKECFFITSDFAKNSPIMHFFKSKVSLSFRSRVPVKKGFYYTHSSKNFFKKSHFLKENVMPLFA